VKQGRKRPRRKNRFALWSPLLLLFFVAPAAGLRAQEDPSPVETPAAEPAEEPPPPAPAAPDLTARVLRAVKDEVKRYGSDSVALVKAPLYWNKGDWEKAGGVVVILGGLMLADRDIDDAARRNRSAFTDKLSSLTTALGDQYGFEISGTLFAAGLLLHHENLRDTGREAIEAGILAHILDRYFFKRAFGRERPADSNGRTVFVPGSNHDSFPSGHATEAFAVASVIATRSKGWPIPVIAYAAATLVAMDRVNNRDHFASDVVAGAFLGTAVGRFLVRRHGEEKSGVLSKADLEVVPIRNGLAARLTF
jgi:membrane-associated phospholipid phosphatase